MASMMQAQVQAAEARSANLRTCAAISAHLFHTLILRAMTPAELAVSSSSCNACNAWSPKLSCLLDAALTVLVPPDSETKLDLVLRKVLDASEGQGNKRATQPPQVELNKGEQDAAPSPEGTSCDSTRLVRLSSWVTDLSDDAMSSLDRAASIAVQRARSTRDSRAVTAHKLSRPSRTSLRLTPKIPHGGQSNLHARSEPPNGTPPPTSLPSCYGVAGTRARSCDIASVQAVLGARTGSLDPDSRLEFTDKALCPSIATEARPVTRGVARHTQLPAPALSALAPQHNLLFAHDVGGPVSPRAYGGGGTPGTAATSMPASAPAVSTAGGEVPGALALAVHSYHDLLKSSTGPPDLIMAQDGNLYRTAPMETPMAARSGALCAQQAASRVVAPDLSSLDHLLAQKRDQERVRELEARVSHLLHQEMIKERDKERDMVSALETSVSLLIAREKERERDKELARDKERQREREGDTQGASQQQTARQNDNLVLLGAEQAPKQGMTPATALTGSGSV